MINKVIDLKKYKDTVLVLEKDLESEMISRYTKLGYKLDERSIEDVTIPSERVRRGKGYVTIPSSTYTTTKLHFSISEEEYLQIKQKEEYLMKLFEINDIQTEEKLSLNSANSSREDKRSKWIKWAIGLGVVGAVILILLAKYGEFYLVLGLLPLSASLIIGLILLLTKNNKYSINKYYYEVIKNKILSFYK